MTGPDLGLWPADDVAADVLVEAAGPDAGHALERYLKQLVAERIASRIAAGDPTLWGDAAVPSASVGLGWVGLADTSRPLVEPIETLRAELLAEGLDRVVLCGPAGSSLAPAVIAASCDRPLVILDGTDPARVRAALVELERTVVVLAGKADTTPETDDLRAAVELAFAAAGIDAARRIVAVADPESPLAALAASRGYRAVFETDPNVGGRYSALTAFGLVPTGLAGVDTGALLDEAAAVADLLAEDSEANPGLVLGAVLGGRADNSSGLAVRNQVLISDLGSGLPGLAEWVEHLLAVVLNSPTAPELDRSADDVIAVRLLPLGAEAWPSDPPSDGLSESASEEPSEPPAGAELAVAGPLGAQFLLWQYATAVAGRLLATNPFDP